MLCFFEWCSLPCGDRNHRPGRSNFQSTNILFHFVFDTLSLLHTTNTHTQTHTDKQTSRHACTDRQTNKHSRTHWHIQLDIYTHTQAGLQDLTHLHTHTPTGTPLFISTTHANQMCDGVVIAEKATSQLLLEPDWDSILQICDSIRQNDVTWVSSSTNQMALGVAIFTYTGIWKKTLCLFSQPDLLCTNFWAVLVACREGEFWQKFVYNGCFLTK